MALPASATMWFQRGIIGSVAEHDGRVYFTQADQTITVLDLDTGRVLRRLTERPGYRSVRACDAGLLVIRLDGLCLLDWDTLAVRWSITSDGYPSILAVRPGLIVLSGDKKLYAIDSSSGKPLWSVQAQSLYSVLVGDRVMTTEDRWTDPIDPIVHTVQVIDLITGQVLRRHDVVQNEGSHLSFAFDGTEVYAIDRNDNEQLLAWQIEANGSLSAVHVQQASDSNSDYVRIAETYFDSVGSPVTADEVTSSNKLVIEEVYRDADVTIFNESPFYSKETWLRIEDRGNTLLLIMPHLRPNDDSSPFITLTDQFFLMSTCRGQVECIERKTGRSLWLYVSPWFYGLISITGGSYIDLSRFVDEFDKEQTDPTKRTPSRLRTPNASNSHQNANADGAILIEDPSPFDPYADLRSLLMVMRLAPIALAALVVAVAIALRRFRRWTTPWIVISAALLFALPVLALRFFVGVNLTGSLVLLIEMATLMLIVLVFGVRSIHQRRQRVWPGLSIIAMCFAAWWIWPAATWVVKMML